MVAAAAAGGGAALLLGDVAGYVVAGTFLLLAVTSPFAPPSTARGLVAVMLSGLVGGIAVGAWAGLTLLTALGDTRGPVVAPDAAALASADGKVGAIGGSAAFRLVLTEGEMRAYALDALRDEPDNPIENLRFDVIPGEDGNGGRLAFEAELKSGGSTAEGAVAARLENGAVEVKIVEIGLGAFQLPGVAEAPLADLVERIAGFDALLSEHRADVQSITFTDDTVVITGTQASTRLITADSFLTGFAGQAAGAVDVADVPGERYGAGEVDGPTAGGEPFYVALGDSLAANVGVASATDGYVSRFHKQLEIIDGVEYGLRNFAVAGETTGTMIRTGQLDRAVEFLEDNDVAYVTIDIGANNLLGHLGAADCSRSLDDPACRERIADAFRSYPADLEQIFDAISAAAPEATILFMTAYNPFNLGFGTDLEAQMSRTLADYNEAAVALALDHGYLVADGFGALEGTAAVTTHMLDTVPDIHPLPIGYDLLTGALVRALR